MGREKLFNWKHNSDTRTNMYKLAIREFNTGETFSLQKTCDPQSRKLLEQPPKQEWWKQDNLVNLETLLKNKLQKCPRTEPVTREKGLFLLETLREWLSKSLMVLYFILKLTKDDKLRISQHWKKTKQEKPFINTELEWDTCAEHCCLWGDGFCSAACSKPLHTPARMLTPHAQEEVLRSQVYRWEFQEYSAEHSVLSCTWAAFLTTYETFKCLSWHPQITGT